MRQPGAPHPPPVGGDGLSRGRPVPLRRALCSDAAEHRRRAQQRVSDIKGLELPGWQEITRRDYAPWPEADLRLDTSRLTAAEAARAIIGLHPADGTR